MQQLDYHLMRESLPAEGLFRGQADWLFSPQALGLDAKQMRQLEGLGHLLGQFQAACMQMYLWSRKGKITPWVAQIIDNGKPAYLRDLQLKLGKNYRPRVLRPDLLWTAEGFKLTEIDSVPGGLGISAWLAKLYAPLYGEALCGGSEGIIEALRSCFKDGLELLVSEESADYKAELAYLCSRLGDNYRVREAENYPLDLPFLQQSGRKLYRFFELFDLENIPGASELVSKLADTDLLNANCCYVLEEKAWLALIHQPGLRAHWQKLLRAEQLERLQQLIPYGWIVDPTPIPAHAGLPMLDAHDWHDVAAFSQSKRHFALKISGFSALGWGARGVHIGHDMHQSLWQQAIEQALQDFDKNVWIMQRFANTALIEHPYYDKQGRIASAGFRLRLCPWYVCEQQHFRLVGSLATLAPADKKKIHGMQDALLVPCYRQD